MPPTFDASGSSFGITQTDWGAPRLASGTVQSSSSTSFTVLDADGLTEVYSGTGFGAFNAQGVPTTGTITGYLLETSGGTPLITATNLTASASTLTDPSGFQFNFIVQNEQTTITGSAFDDFFLASAGDTVSTGAGNDTVEFGSGTAASTTLDGGSGFDTLLLAAPFNSGSNAYVANLEGAQLSSFEQVQFFDRGDGHENLALFDLGAFGAGLASNLNVIGTSGVDSIQFIGSTPGTYDFSQMTFANWTNAMFQGDPSGDFVSIQASGAGSFNITGPAHSSGLITGGSGADTLTGGALGDILTGGPGNDTINGGGGLNVAAYTDIASTAATITHNLNGSWTVSSAADGTDTLTNIQLLHFSDRYVALQPDWVRRDNFLAGGQSDFLIENSSGAVFAGDAHTGAASYTALGALGPEWKFVGNGDFNGGGTSEYMIENGAGAVFWGELVAGSVSFHQVSALGPEWSFKGTGGFLGRNHADFLIENTSGAVAVGEVNNTGVTTFLQVASLAGSQKIVASGDFVGIGETSFLVQNADGSVNLAAVNSSGQAVLTPITALGPEWKFEGAGNLLGDNKSDFLIQNGAGQVDVGELGAGNAVTFTQLTSLGPEWKFVGAGDYLGEGHDQFLIENASGAVVVGDWTGGQIHFTNVAALGPEWVFHS